MIKSPTIFIRRAPLDLLVRGQNLPTPMTCTRGFPRVRLKTPWLNSNVSSCSPVLWREAVPAAMPPGRANGLYVGVVGVSGIGSVAWSVECRPFRRSVVGRRRGADPELSPAPRTPGARGRMGPYSHGEFGHRVRVLSFDGRANRLECSPMPFLAMRALFTCKADDENFDHPLFGGRSLIIVA